MKAYDFEYGGESLSSYGYMICQIGSKGVETLSGGAEITFNTLAVHGGTKHEVVSIQYNDCLETTIQICKNPCGNDNMEISVDEFRLLQRWLNRKGFYKFKILGDEYFGFYFEAKFNVKRIEFEGKVIALELDVKTNRPFALEETTRIIFENKVAGEEHLLIERSDVEGHIYPKTRIVVLQDGDLDIYNQIEDRHTVITGCKNGDVIDMDYPLIFTSRNEHAIQNCFNWNFFRVANSYQNNLNRITMSLQCKMEIEYAPQISVGL